MSSVFRSKKGKSGDVPPWVILIVLALVFLLPQSPLNLFSLLGGEQTFVWQGLNWKHNSNDAADSNANPLGISVSGESLLLGMSCNHPSRCDGYFRSDFDLSKFIEVRILITANTAAHIGGNSMAAWGNFGFGIDNVGYSAVGSYAEERGGTQIFSDGDRTEATITMLRTDNGWDIYKSDIKVANTSVANPSLKFSFGAGGSQSSAGGSASAEIFFQAKSSSLLVKKLLCEATKGAYLPTTNDCVCPSNSKGFTDGVGCDYNCLPDEVKLSDGTCKALIRTCIDNNLNNICDPDDPIVWKDPDLNIPICADRDNNRVCDDVQSLFCKDSNSNNICDSDEEKWLATYCKDVNGNGICDGIESGTVACPNTYVPVCDPATNITFPNSCFASGFGITATEAGACKVSPVIIRLDCTSGQVPIPSGYICNPETGWLIKTEKVYQNITLDCRSLPPTEGYTCKNIGEQWVFVKTELVNIDCYSKGCPSGSQCQGGLCTKETTLKCPFSIDCEAKYGQNSACDEETGLCVLKQYLTQDCKVLGCPSGNACTSQNGTNVCVQTSQALMPSTIQKKQQGGIFGTPAKISPTAIIALLVGVAGLVMLAQMKKP